MSALGWTALVGGGALAAYALLGDRRAPRPTRSGDELAGDDLDALARLTSPAASPPAPAVPADTSALVRVPMVPAAAGPKNTPLSRGPKNTPGSSAPPPSPRRPDAPISAWNRRADDGGPPIYVGDDVEALARVISSEVERGAVDERVAVGWVARNLARQRRVPVARLFCWPCGPRTGERPFSTRLPATTLQRELAAIMLASPASDDPTRGAIAAFDPALQDRLAAATFTAATFDARSVRRRWLRTTDYYGTVGRFDLFGPKNGPGAKPIPRAWAIDRPESGLPASELE